MSLEPIQFEVGLTKDKSILNQLKKNKMWREDTEGPYLAIQFDAQEFKFRPGTVYTVGRTVGNALIRSSAVLIGTDPLSDPYLPYVVKIAEHQLGQTNVKKAQFECPICHEDQKSAPRLARHLMDQKVHKPKPDVNDIVEEDEGQGSDGEGEAVNAVEASAEEV